MIFYFSATGNSKYAAQKLQEAFGGEMINIAEAVRKERFLYGTAQDEKVFFVLPVYFWNSVMRWWERTVGSKTYIL